MTPEIHKIIRSSRKTIALEISPKAELIVRLPRLASLHSAYRFINAKKDWILKKQQEILQNSLISKTFQEGDEFLFLGKKYSLHFVSDIKSPIIFNDKAFFISNTYGFRAREIFESWYRRQARKIIAERVDYFSQKFDLKYRQIKITSARKRWGSCTSQKNLNFSWRLVMAPLEIIDSVVVHELCHTQEMNHGKNFWRLVESIQPEYKTHRKWLRKNQSLLKFE